MKKSLFVAGAATAAALVYIENFSIETTEYTVVSDKIPEEFNGYKIVQLSDFHCKNFGNRNKILIDKIVSANPDIVLFTGDMVSREDTNMNPFIILHLRSERDFLFIIQSETTSLTFLILSLLKCLILSEDMG